MIEPDHHRLLPSAPDAERGVLSSFMLAPREVGAIVAERRIGPHHFHIPSHATIFALMVGLWVEGVAFDFITLTQTLRDQGRLDEVGGAALISDIFTFVPTALRVGEYVEILEEKFTSREIVKLCTEYAMRGYDEQDEPENLLLELQEALTAIFMKKQTTEKTFRALLMETLDSIERGDDSHADVLSGIDSLDNILRMRRGNFIVISGEAKSGKTALAGTILTNAAVLQEKRCAIFSLEMSDMEMMKRALSCTGRVNISMMGRQPTENELTGLHRGATALGDVDVEIITDCRELGEITAKCRQLHSKRPLDLVILDYIQLVDFSTGRRSENRQESVAQISRTCKRIAGEMNCVLIGLSQVNDEGKLRESRAIGQDANAVVAVEKEEDEGRIIRVVAQRSGKSNAPAKVRWLPQYSRFESV